MAIPGTRTYYRAADLARAWRAVLRGDLGSGAEVAALEAAFAARLERPAAAAFPAARVALYYGLRASGLPAGSEILLTPLTIPDIPAMIRCAGFVPRFVEMDPRTLDVSLPALARAIGRRTRGLVWTPLYGLVPARADELLAAARRAGLFLIEDVSQGFGARLEGRPLGGQGDLSITSLSSFKLVSALFGGILSARDPALVERARVLGHAEAGAVPRGPFVQIVLKAALHGAATAPGLFDHVTLPLLRPLIARHPEALERAATGNLAVLLGRDADTPPRHVPASYLFPFTAFQARLALASLDQMEGRVARLRSLAARLLALPGVAARAPATHAAGEPVYWRFPLRVRPGERLWERLLAHGITPSRGRLPLLSERSAFAFAGARDLPGARAVQAEHLLVPVHGDMDAAHADALVVQAREVLA